MKSRGMPADVARRAPDLRLRRGCAGTIEVAEVRDALEELTLRRFSLMDEGAKGAESAEGAMGVAV